MTLKHTESEGRQESTERRNRPIGVITLGFLFMLSAFPLFLHLISTEVDSPSSLTTPD